MDINALLTEQAPKLMSWAIKFGPKLIIAVLIFIIGRIIVRKPVSYTHLTLPTIYSV